MSATVQLKGGVPVHINGTTAGGTVEEWNWQGGRSNYLWFENTGAAAIALSFSKADADAARAVSVAAGAQVLLPVEAVAFWTNSVGAQSFQAVAFLHRG